MLIDVVRDGLEDGCEQKNRPRNYGMIDAKICVSIEYGAVRHTDIFVSKN